MTSKARLAAAPASGRRSRTLSEAGPWPRLLQFVDATLPGRITLRDLEEISGLDQYRLIRRCRRDLGVTPHALVLGRRLALAAGLLRRGEAVASVAAEAGFFDQSHLSRHFRRAYGTSPACYAARFPDPLQLGLTPQDDPCAATAREPSRRASGPALGAFADAADRAA